MHMFHADRVRNFEKYPPTLIKKNVGSPSSPDGISSEQLENEVKPGKVPKGTNQNAEMHVQNNGENSKESNNVNNSTSNSEDGHMTSMGLFPPVAELKFNYRCDQCDAKFMYRDTYDLHDREHLNKIHPFKCHECPEAFFYVRGLNNHKDTHNKQKKSNSEIYESDGERGRKRTKDYVTVVRQRSDNSVSRKLQTSATNRYPKRFGGKLKKNRRR